MQKVLGFLNHFRGGVVPLLTKQKKGLNGTIRGGQYEYSGSGDGLFGRPSTYWRVLFDFSKQECFCENHNNDTNKNNSAGEMACSFLHGSGIKFNRCIQSHIGWSGCKINGNIRRWLCEFSNFKRVICEVDFPNLLCFCGLYGENKTGCNKVSTVTIERGCA